MTQITIGIDISKDNLDVATHPDGMTRQFANTAKGIGVLIKWMKGLEGFERIIFEPTSRYHKALEKILRTTSFPFAKINGYQIKRFADGIGRRAKTDKIDAMTLAIYGSMVQPECARNNDIDHQVIDLLKEYLAAHRALIKDRTAMKNRLAATNLNDIAKQLKASLQLIERHIADIEQKIKAAITQNEQLNQSYQRLLSIGSIGSITAMTLLIEMPELGSMNKKQAASLAGLAPISRQSGKWIGKAHIAGGRSHIRNALFMPALVAIRYNPWLKATYEHLIESGKPKKAAITAIMRKLVILANALIRDNRKFT